MAPNAQMKELDVNGVLNETDAETIDGGLSKPVVKFAERRKLKLVWRNIILFAYLHVAAIYGLWLMLTSAKWATGAFGESDISLFKSY